MDGTRRRRGAAGPAQDRSTRTLDLRRRFSNRRSSNRQGLRRPGQRNAGKSEFLTPLFSCGEPELQANGEKSRHLVDSRTKPCWCYRPNLRFVVVIEHTQPEKPSSWGEGDEVNAWASVVRASGRGRGMQHASDFRGEGRGVRERSKVDHRVGINRVGISCRRRLPERSGDGTGRCCWGGKNRVSPSRRPLAAKLHPPCRRGRSVRGWCNPGRPGIP